MLDQSGLRMIVLTRFVTYAWPSLILAGGCSETLSFGITQETAGSVPASAAE